jgi:hypothetical protein
VRVAEKFGMGKVKVSMSFADWKAGHVAAATYEVPLPPPEGR